MVETISKEELRTAIKETLREILHEERGFLRVAVKELMDDEIKAADSMSDAEVRASAHRQFQKYAAVFKALA